MRLLLKEGVVLPEIEDHGKTALIRGGRVLSYRELIENISSFANLADVLPGERVLICAENRPEWIYALYGSWQRGAVVVPVDFMSSTEEVAYILRETEPLVVFYSEQTKESVLPAVEEAGLKPYLYNFDTLVFPKPYHKFMSRELKETALILYTSGTTGKPKGVMLSFENLFSNIKAIEKVGVAGKNDVTLALLPFHHSYPLMVTLLVPLYLGATIVFLERLSSEELLKALKEHGITILVGVPRLYQVLHQRIMEGVKANPVGRLMFYLSPFMSGATRRMIFKKVHKAFGGRLKFFVSGGAKLPVDVASDLERLGFTFLEGYGLTETSPIVSFNPPEKPKLGSVGLPIEGVYVKIAEDGEVLVSGVNVMQGYYKKPEETEKAFKDGWLLTGDLGYLDSEGYLYITGRKKEVLVLSGGKKVNPEEIEIGLMKTCPELKEVAIFEMDGTIKALIVPDLDLLREKGILNVEEYIRWQVVDKLNQKMPEWKRITGFRILKGELPKTRLGKIKRFLLPQLFMSSQVAEEEREEDPIFKMPEGQVLKSYLQKVSQKDVKGYHHIELDLGLDSLSKVELMSFIETTFGIQLTEEDLASNPTVEELLRLVLERKEKVEVLETGWEDILSKAQPYNLEDYPKVFSFGRFLLRLFFRLYNRLEVVGVENLPEPPFILAPNHASYLDGFVLASALPSNVASKTYFLGAEEYFTNPLTSLFGKLAHVITVNLNRKLRESLQKTSWALRTGKTVVIFPEGARTRDGKLLPFRKGFAILSKELSLPVVPVAIVGTYQSMSIRDRLPKPTKIKVIFGKPVYPDNKSYDEIVEELKSHVENLITRA
ncbi:MAG: AMP-binding protein [Aquificaceae bacterium]|nr:AMP-binding protein [Aquificaceae bacterium]MDW8433640.1 AMP-binding protein [Aquificaceae bacterium]